MPQRPHDTALGVARQRFVDGLGQKSAELRGALALLVASPDAARPRDDFRARLQALYASAQVFRMAGLASALSDGTKTLDIAKSEGRGVSQRDLDELTHLVATLPSMVDSPPRQSPSVPPVRASSRPRAPLRPHKATIIGMKIPGTQLPGLTAPAPPQVSAPPRVSAPPAIAPVASAPAVTAPPVQAPRVRAPAAPTPAPIPRPVPAARPPTSASTPAVTPRPASVASVAPPVAKPAAAAPLAAAAGAPVARAASSKSATPALAAEDQALDRFSTPAKPVVSSKRVSRTAPVAPASSAPVPATAAAAQVAAGATSSGGYSAPSQQIVSALLLTDSASETLIRVALPAERFELVSASSVEQATQLAWTNAPDLILADSAAAMAPGGLLELLRRDALTDFVPVVLLFPAGSQVDLVALREAGAVDALRKPLDAVAVAQTVHRVADLGEAATWAPLGDLTVNDVAARIAEEIRKGLVLANDRGPDVAVPLGDGSEVMAAAWAAIARVRAHLSERSAGRVHFRDPGGRHGPSLMSLNELEPADSGDADSASAQATADISLRGRRIVLADDDPAVRWFFAQLLEEEGALVVQAEDGLQALQAARVDPPDVIISDILMPNMDGLALCRALSRDPAVSETPIILLSWKEDFLSRMRELRAGARGYLRKEAESPQILAKVRDVLRPRAQFEARLRAGGELRGRVEGLGIPALVETVKREREHALITVRDAFNLFEIEIQDRQLTSVSSTATDGGFARGDRALTKLVGVSTGRYSVQELDTSERHSMAGGAPRGTVAQACERLGAMIDAVSGESLASVGALQLDEDALESFQQTAPGEVGAVATALGSGTSPRDLLVGSVHAPQVVEAALVELARRGVITAVRGEEGEDRVALAREARHLDPEVDLRDDARAATHEDVSELGDPAEEQLEILEDPIPLLSVAAPTPAEPAHLELVDPDPIPLTPAPSLAPPEVELLERDVDVAQAASAAHDTLPLSPAAPPSQRSETGEQNLPRHAADADEGDEAELAEGFGPLTWVAVLFMLAAIGYVGYMLVVKGQASSFQGLSAAPAEPATAATAATEGDPSAAATQAGVAAAGAETGQQAEEGEAQAADAGVAEGPSEDGITFGELRPGVRLEGAEVPAGHGVLHVLATPQEGVVVTVGEQELGAPPQQIALPEGRHSVRFAKAGEVIYRYYFVRADHTRVVPVPES